MGLLACTHILLMRVLCFRQEGALSAGAIGEPSTPTHRLDGFIAYYGRHYFAYWRRAHPAEAAGDAERWDGFDDASVRDAGTWTDVIEKVSDGRLMPLLLFFSPIGSSGSG